MRNFSASDLSSPDRSPVELLRKDVVAAGALAGILLNIYALLVPVFDFVGGGIVAGFLAGYALGGLAGLVNGIVAGAIVGAAAGGLVGLTGFVVNLYMQPPTISAGFLGMELLPATFDGFTPIGLLAIVVFTAGLVAVDALLGAVLGAAVEAGVRKIRG